jgi:hypothetical protein
MKTNFLLLLVLLIVTAAALGDMRTQSKPQRLGFSPEVVTFTATPPVVRAGEPVKLSWETRGTQSISLEWGAQQPSREAPEVHPNLPASGTMTVTPKVDTVYELRCYTVAGPMCLPISEVVHVK